MYISIDDLEDVENISEINRQNKALYRGLKVLRNKVFTPFSTTFLNGFPLCVVMDSIYYW